MKLVDIIGFLATFTSCISLLPQTIKSFREKSTKDLSLMTLVILLLTSSLWMAYGFMTAAWAVWTTNIVMVIFSVIMLILKHRYG